MLHHFPLDQTPCSADRRNPTPVKKRSPSARSRFFSFRTHTEDVRNPSTQIYLLPLLRAAPTKQLARLYKFSSAAAVMLCLCLLIKTALAAYISRLLPASKYWHTGVFSYSPGLSFNTHSASAHDIMPTCVLWCDVCVPSSHYIITLHAPTRSCRQCQHLTQFKQISQNFEA